MNSLSLESIIGRGSRVYDLLGIIALATGINILTSVVTSEDVLIISLNFLFTGLSGVFFILAGVNFSWLSYWIRRYVEQKNKNNLIEAIQGIINDRKEVAFKKRMNIAVVFITLGIVILLIGRACG